MTLRITREEGEWLRMVLGAYRELSARRLKTAKRDKEQIRYHRDMDVATGMMGLIDDAMARRAR